MYARGYVYVCVCIFLCVCIYTCVYLHTMYMIRGTYVFMCMSAFTQNIYIYMYRYVYTYIYIHIYRCTFAYRDTHASMCKIESGIPRAPAASPAPR